MSEPQQNDSNEAAPNKLRPKKISFKVKPIGNKNAKAEPRDPNLVRSQLFEKEDDDGKSETVSVKGIDISKGTAIVDQASKSSKPTETKKELVIPALPNRDWRNNIQRRQGGSRYQPSQEFEAESKVEIPKEEKLTIGLNKGVKGIELNNEESTLQENSKQEEETKPKTEDEKAVLALINSGVSSNPTDDITITSANSLYNRSVTYVNSDEEKDEEFVEPISEAEAFARDVSSRPDAPSLNAYNRMPVEEFGAALLRGMGWKGPESDKTRNDKTRTVDIDGALRRPAFLGIGAKPMDLNDDMKSLQPSTEIGAWGKSTNKRDDRKYDRIYVPLIKIDKETGEPVSENEEEHRIKNFSLEKKIHKDSRRDTYDDDKYNSRKREIGSKERRSRSKYEDDEKEYKRKRISKDYESSRRSDYRRSRSPSPERSSRRHRDSRDYHRERDRRDDDRDRSDINRYKEISRDYDKDSRNYRKNGDRHDYIERDDKYRNSSRKNDKKYSLSSSSKYK